MLKEELDFHLYDELLLEFMGLDDSLFDTFYCD
jgi:hypothetical protein